MKYTNGLSQHDMLFFFHSLLEVFKLCCVFSTHLVPQPVLNGIIHTHTMTQTKLSVQKDQQDALFAFSLL
jgi:hypothetical protein